MEESNGTESARDRAMRGGRELDEQGQKVQDLASKVMGEEKAAESAKQFEAGEKENPRDVLGEE